MSLGVRGRARRKGRVLAIKWGLNPNSSSLGVDVTFLLLGATALSIATPIVSTLVRLRLASSAAGASTSASTENYSDPETQAAKGSDATPKP